MLLVCEGGEDIAQWRRIPNIVLRKIGLETHVQWSWKVRRRVFTQATTIEVHSPACVARKACNFLRLAELWAAAGILGCRTHTQARNSGNHPRALRIMDAPVLLYSAEVKTEPLNNPTGH
eukprot:scaffold15696_cov113-Isochrysis_galbana.AAC.10